MKSFGILHILLFIVMLLVYQCTKAQDLFVSTKGDTLVGILSLDDLLGLFCDQAASLSMLLQKQRPLIGA